MTEHSTLTVAVPVYNGENFLDEALANIAAESAVDLHIVVYDNASTDRSAEIAMAWSLRDARIRVIRRKQNIGAVRNFADAAVRANTPYFAWRAYDDLSAPGYFGALIDSLKEAPSSILAIPKCQTLKSNGKQQVTPVAPGALQLDQAISAAHPSWLYGVWRTSFAQTAAVWTRGNAPSLWGWDHLALLQAALSGTFLGCPQALFIRRLGKGPEKAHAGISSKEKQNLRAEMLSIGQNLISSHRINDRKHYCDLWDALVERRIVRRRIRTFDDLITKFRIQVGNRGRAF